MRKIGSNIYLALIVMFLYLPILTLAVFSFNKAKTMAVWSGFSLKWYKAMLENDQIIEAIRNTFSIAFVAALVSTFIGTFACLGMNKMRKKSQNVLMGLNNIPLLNADIVIGISLMMTFLAFKIDLSWTTVLLSHITFCIPYVILSVLPKIKQLSPSAYEAAVDDFVITHFTRGAGINTISTLIYSQVKVGIKPTLFALSTVIFILVLVILVVTNILSGIKEGKGR